MVDRATYSRAGPARRSHAAARPTPEQVEAWQTLVRAFNGVTRMTEASIAGSQLDPSDYDVLLTLAQGPPEGLRPIELTQRVLITKSGMTRLVDRLEERGLIERRECATDRRGRLIALTSRGRHLQRRAAPALLHALATALGTLSPGDITALKRVSERMLEATTAHSAE